MRKLRNIFAHTVNIFANKRSYFENLKNRGADFPEALILSLFSAVMYGILNSARTLVSNGVGEYATITTLSEATSTGINNTFDGFLFFLLTFGFISAVTHITALKAGLKNWKTTAYALAYSTPAINIYITSLLVYELFQKFIIGFPLIKYILALISLAYVGTILAKAIEIFHETTRKKALWVAASPIILVIATQAALTIYVMISLLSAL